MQAIEVEAEGSVVRSYPTGARGREMSGDDHHWTIGEGLEESPACRARQYRVYAEAAVELGFGALQRRVHDIAAQDHGACGDRATTQTWPGVCPGQGSIHTLSSNA